MSSCTPVERCQNTQWTCADQSGCPCWPLSTAESWIMKQLKKIKKKLLKCLCRLSFIVLRKIGIGRSDFKKKSEISWSQQNKKQPPLKIKNKKLLYIYPHLAFSVYCMFSFRTSTSTDHSISLSIFLTHKLDFCHCFQCLRFNWIFSLFCTFTETDASTSHRLKLTL